MRGKRREGGEEMYAGWKNGGEAIEKRGKRKKESEKRRKEGKERKQWRKSNILMNEWRKGGKEERERE